MTRLILSLLLLLYAVTADEPLCIYSSPESNSSIVDGITVEGSTSFIAETCPFSFTVNVFANTSEPLAVGEDYEYELMFANASDATNSSTPPTIEYRIVLCWTENVRYCNALTEKGQNDTAAGYLVQDFRLWPEGEDRVNLTVNVEMGGTYAVYGHIRMTSGLDRLHLLQVIHGYTVFYSEVPEAVVLTNSKGFIIGAYVVSESYALILTLMFIYICKHRNHPLLKMAQAPFLAVQMLCAIITVSCFFVFLPLSDTTCNLHAILMIFPITILAATLVGRLWRTYSVVKVAMRLGKSATEDRRGKRVLGGLKVLANLHVLLKGHNPRNIKYSLRSQVTEFDLTRLIFMLFLPQLIVQLVATIAFPRKLELIAVDNGLVGRQRCTQDGFLWFGLAYFLFLFCLAVFVAWVGRDLPSLLNEKEQIFNAGSFSVILIFIIVPSILLAGTPTTNPDVISLLWMVVVFGIISSVVWIIIWPKIARVRKGGKVVVSNLLRPNRLSSSDTGVLTTSVNTLSNQPIVLEMHEPPPRKVEAQMLRLKDMLLQLTRQSLDGEAISLQDWRDLTTSVDIFQHDLHRIEYAWTKEDETKEAIDQRPLSQRSAPNEAGNAPANA